MSSTGFAISLRRDIKWLNHTSRQRWFKEGKKFYKKKKPDSSPHKAWRHHSWRQDEELSCGKKRSAHFTLAVKVAPEARQLQPAVREPWEETEGGGGRCNLGWAWRGNIPQVEPGVPWASSLQPFACRDQHFSRTLMGSRHMRAHTQPHWACKAHSHFSRVLSSVL